LQTLLSSDKVEQAFSLLEMAQLKFDKRENLLRKIHRKAVFVRFAEFDLPLCKDSISQSELDLREVIHKIGHRTEILVGGKIYIIDIYIFFQIISLFPSILPNSTVFTRSLPQLHEYLDVNQVRKKVQLHCSKILYYRN